jgi:hypothetical protein
MRATVRFVAHADTFWANVSSDYAYDTAYPSGPIKPGGIGDQWISVYSHFWATCRRSNATPSSDRRGGGNTKPSPRLHGKCIARETLAAVHGMSKPHDFLKIRWENGTSLLGLPSRN